MPTVEILAVGNELLDGVTRDTNTHWLCQQITRLGSRVERAALVRDNPVAIAGEVAGACLRHVALLLVTGGLGPTADDLTLAAVAQAAGVPLVENPMARRMVADVYADLHRRGAVAFPELTPERLKMARLPGCATPIANPVGAAPAVVLHLRGTTIVCLPGVPSELKGIFTGPLQPVLAEALGAGVALEREVVVALNDESAMAPALREVASRHPEVYVKSHAHRFEGDEGIRVTFSARGARPDAVSRLLDAAVADLRARLPLREP
ncbi:MAG: competence/damage-inducible protein A [Armatimonadetes bacterium]|nr:competence/damage-inducible protein A [Armatimonadota bacterium]